MAKKEKDFKDTIAEMQKQQCCWPGCEEKMAMTVSIPMLNVLEGGKIEASESSAIGVPVCDSHMFYMMSGLFGIKQDPKTQQSHIMGPFELFDVVEAVVAAHNMAKLKQREKAQKDAKKTTKPNSK